MKTCRKDFQGRKSTTVLKLLCRNIAAGRFNWRRYCTPQTYFGQEICVTPLHCSYGQIGYTVHFPYSNMPEVEYDWEMGKLTVDEENWKEYFRHSEHDKGLASHQPQILFIHRRIPPLYSASCCSSLYSSRSFSCSFTPWRLASSVMLWS